MTIVIPPRAKNTNLQKRKVYALWRMYVMKLMRKDSVLGALTEHAPGNTKTTAVAHRFKKTGE